MYHRTMTLEMVKAPFVLGRLPREALPTKEAAKRAIEKDLARSVLAGAVLPQDAAEELAGLYVSVRL